MRTELQKQARATGISVRVAALTKTYAVRHRPWSKRIAFTAVSDISFDIPAGRTLALVGSSGSGKSTVARCITRFEKPDTGQVWLGDVDVAQLTSSQLQPLRSQIQLIFQDPATAMNPRMSAGEVIAEPLAIQKRGSRSERRARAADLMAQVGLSPDWMNRPITEFSGGQKQRIAIARALTLDPGILVLDEALSGLDLSTQAQIAGLLRSLQQSRSLTYLLISHDLGLVARLADRIAIMSAGRIVEQASAREILLQPRQPETQSLVTAAERFQKAVLNARGASA